MNTVYFDLEWNTGFLDGDSFDEVIEIGAVKVDEQHRRVDGFRRLIRPTVYRKMNPYIQKILAFTMKDLQKEDPFPVVVREFFEWCNDCDALIAWSTNDYGVFEKNLARIGLTIPEHLRRYDLQMAYAYRTEKSIHSYALKTAVEALELPEPEDQTYHDAYYDAQYTASIGKTLIERYGELPSTEELEAFRATQVKPKKAKLPLKYSVKKAIRRKEYCSFPCPTCGEMLHLRCWYALDGTHFISRVKCPEDGWRYAELTCDHFRQDKCDAHFTLWGEACEYAAKIYEKAIALDHFIRLYGPSKEKDNENS